MHLKRFAVYAAMAAAVLFYPFGARAEEAAGPKDTGKVRPGMSATVVDQRALDILKGMSDSLKSAKTLSFRARSLEPIKSPAGIWVILFSDSRVMIQEPDKLFVEKRGDVFALDFYFDGKTISLYSPARNVFAEKESPGTIDDVIEGVKRQSDNPFPYSDILISDPYSRLTSDLVGAVYVGRSTLGGVKTDHLAFSNKGVDWQIWIGADDKLPRLVNATYLDDASEPSYTVEFTDWKINDALSPEIFAYQNSTQASKIEFRKPGRIEPDSPRPSDGQ
ncbi:MAG TPA: DUF2092 domain-containing protein [Candidatus Omnitrophota bacterium]|nr:DUF2092 domain-containing protein [Candidatus Omnitrophota bacterium]